MKDLNTIGPEDYEEPVCLLSMDPPGEAPRVTPVPWQRIMDKLDRHMSRRDYEGAEQHLLYWLQEAVRGNDRRGQLMICNELIGHYRKTGKREPAFSYIEKALDLLIASGLEGTVTAGTTYVNAATACSAFQENERALTLFEKAKSLYEASANTPSRLLGGLYNNMALAHQALGHYKEAYGFYEKAMEQMGNVAGGALEQAITCLNMADTVAAEQGMEQGETQIFSLLDRASDLLKDPEVPHDGYYAFVCEKCAPSFSWYGYFAVAEELRKEAKEIYERA